MSALWELPDRPSAGKSLRWYLATAWRLHPWMLGATLGAAVVAGLMRGTEVWALRYLIDRLTQGDPAGARFWSALFWVGCIGVAHLLARLLEALQSLSRSKLEYGLALALRTQLLATAAEAPLLTAEQPEFRDALHQAGEAGGSLTNLLGLLLLLCGELATFSTYAALVVTVHPLFPLVLGLALLPVIWVRMATGVDYQSLLNQRTTQHRQGDYLAGLFFRRESFAEIRLFGLEQHLINAWSSLSSRLRRERIARVARHQAASFAGNFFIVTAAVLGFWLGTRGVLAGLMSLGALVAGMEALNRAMSQMQTMVNYVGFIQRDLLRLSPLLWVVESASALETPVPEGPARIPSDHLAIDGTALAGPAPNGQGLDNPATAGPAPIPSDQEEIANEVSEIRLENVSFAYPGAERRTLQGVSLTLRAGERIALVGANGAGKSTLAALLLGLYEPTGGRILIDGVDRRDILPERRRKLVSAVFQQVVQYQMRLRDQLEFFGESQPEGELRRALATASLDRLTTGWPVRLKQHMGRLFGGLQLSGGEWQKLAIARALLRSAPLLVVDEPTAALDPQAEVAVLASCLRPSARRLTVVISHRLGVCTQVDRILVLDDGRLVEDGNHAALVAAGGLYARFWEAQSAWYGDETPWRSA